MSTFLTFDDEHIAPYLTHWAPELMSVMRIVRYREVLRRPFEPGCYVFADLDRPTGHRALPKWGAYARVRTLGDRAVVLNGPLRALGRYELLRLLHERGLNDFNVYRLHELHEADAAGKVRYPVFLRRDRDHMGPLTPLLHSLSDVQRAVDALPAKLRVILRAQLIVTEHMPCVHSDGVTRKYGVQRIGRALLPRHVLFSDHWMVKFPKIINEETVAEEEAFVDACPHLDQVRHVFDLAGIDYGRIDYGVRDGRIQVWEINTAPSLFPAPETVRPVRLALQRRCAAAITAAFRALDDEGRPA
jgi:hypothetical protein